MTKQCIYVQETLNCGIDVSTKSLTVAIQRVRQPVERVPCGRLKSLHHDPRFASQLKKLNFPI
jgi:hypothetical protein